MNGVAEDGSTAVRYFAGAFGDRVVNRTRARQLLQCDDAELDGHVARGLPTLGGTGTFGYCDVMNAGLYSGSGRSVAELASRYLSRIGAAERRDRLAERRWSIRLTHGCGERCGSSRRPAAPAQGDTVALLRGWDRAAGPDEGWEAEVALGGVAGAVSSPQMRDLYRRSLHELRSGTIRYQYLPPRLRADAGAARRLGVADCLTTARWLHEGCAALGIPSRTRFGYLLGMVAIEHAWVEVLDGAVRRPLDPVLAVLVGAPNRVDAELDEFFLGSRPNALLPWPAGSESPLHPPACDHDGAVATLTALPLGTAAAEPQGAGR